MNKKAQGRRDWGSYSHKRIYANDWVLNYIEKDKEYEFGINYVECGICKLCTQENVFEMVKYLCRIDFIQAVVQKEKSCLIKV